MSQAAEHISTLKEMLKKYRAMPLPVIETFYELVTNQSWSSSDVIDFLEAGKGESEYSDDIIDKFIAKEKKYK